MPTQRPVSGWVQSGTAYLEFAHEEPGLFATAFAVPEQHAYGAPGRRNRAGPFPPGAASRRARRARQGRHTFQQRRDSIEYPIWSTVHGLAVLTGQGPLRDVPDATRDRLAELTFTFIGEGLA